MRSKYWDFGYEEVVTPNIFNLDLWKTSGHAEHYKQNMFLIDIEKAEFGLKPMNCPGDYHLFCSKCLRGCISWEPITPYGLGTSNRGLKAAWGFMLSP